MKRKIYLFLLYIMTLLILLPNKVYALGFCDEGKTLEDGSTPSLGALIDNYWGWIMLLVPIALIGLITYDFFSATISGDSDRLKKSTSNAFRRVIAALLLLLTPLIVSTVFSWFGLEVCF